MTSPWGMGLLTYHGVNLDSMAMVPNGTRIGEWLFNTADNRFGPVGDFDSDGQDEVLISSPWGIASLKFGGSTLTPIMIAANGTRIGEWLLKTADNVL